MMQQIVRSMPIYSTLLPLIEVPAHGRVVVSEEYLRGCGVMGMSHGFRRLYVGQEVRDKGSSTLALRKLNWEVSDRKWRRVIGRNAEVTILEFAVALSLSCGRKGQIYSHIRGVGSNYHFSVAAATYVEGAFSGWVVDVNSIMSKNFRPAGSIFITQH